MQRPGIDFQETFAPIARLDSFRLLVALSARLDLIISQLDVTTVYLNSDINTEIYMAKPPLLDEMLRRMIKEERDTDLTVRAKRMLSKNRGKDRVCLLNRAIYGLKQAGCQ